MGGTSKEGGRAIKKEEKKTRMDRIRKKERDRQKDMFVIEREGERGRRETKWQDLTFMPVSPDVIWLRNDNPLSGKKQLSSSFILSFVLHNLSPSCGLCHH